MEAMIQGTPVIGVSSALTTAVAGTVYAVPQKSGNPERAITLSFAFASAPGASVFRLFQSIDNVTFAQLGVDITEAAPVVKNLVNCKFIRLDQVSKTNAVASVGTLLLG